MGKNTNEPVDVVIVGVGASGGTAAKVLSERGLRVVGLERGPHLDHRQHFSGDELKFLNRGYLAPSPQLDPRTYRNDASEEAEVYPFSPCPQLVGGGTVHWAGYFPRPFPDDFKLRSLHGAVADSSLVDWPVGYDDLEPYLTKVEWEFGCSGLAGSSPHEPWRSKDYPTPPARPTAFAKRFYRACERMGINACPLPTALVTEPHKGRDTNNRTGLWNQYGDPTTTRSTTLTSFVPEALATGNFDLRAESLVREITLRPDGRAKGVVYIDREGREVEQEAEVVILCQGAIETARLLLLSQSNRFPDGLANSSGLVGRNVTFHEWVCAVGLFDPGSDPLHGYTGPWVSGATFDFNRTDESRGHIGGGIVAASQVGQPINYIVPGRPTWGQALKDADRDYFDRAVTIGFTAQDLPQHQNMVDLDPSVRDSNGLPVARITYQSHRNDVAQIHWQVRKNTEILETMGAEKTLPVNFERVTGNTCHQHGTARMGTDPGESVVDPWCRTHDVDNLFLMDGSWFPTATGVNPTLTIMANAWRCCDHIADVRAKGRELEFERREETADAR
ncbi:MAG: GMC family oxidoreductase [Acidimicrobiia bacterium]